MSKPTKTSRRSFLAGHSAVEALGDALAGPRMPLPPPKSVGVQPGSHLLSVSREAMACLFEVVFDAATYREGSDVAIEALELVARLEDQLTVYRDTSEVSHINQNSGERPVVIEEGLFKLLRRAVLLSAETGGAFDITAGRLSKIWGFYRRQGQMPSPEEIDGALTTVGSQHLQFDEGARTLQFLKHGLELNLGACGKGYALDSAADSLIAGGIHDFLIHGGNSSVLARGKRANSEFSIQNSEKEICEEPRIGWTVALRHPLLPEVRLAEFVLADQALGTSGSGTQFFHHQGKRYGHILDPRSGWPADQVLSATVVAPTAELADALSTAFYVFGVEPAQEYCVHHPEISALVTKQGKSAGSIDLLPINLSDDRWRRLP